MPGAHAIIIHSPVSVTPAGVANPFAALQYTFQTSRAEEISSAAVESQ